MRRRRARLPAALVSAAALAACAVGPDYESPLPDVPAQGAFAGAEGFGDEAPAADWWTLYGDAALTAAVEEALTANTDVRIAAANLERARALELGARGERFPDVTLEAGATRSREPVLSQQPPVVFEDTTYTLGLDVAYQADVFGRVRRTLEAVSADSEASAAALDVTRLTVAAETARAYAEACATAYRIDVARDSVSLEQQNLELTERLLDAGRGTAFDVARAAAQLEQTRAVIPGLEARRNATLYRLAVLRGHPPATGTAGAATCRIPLSLSGAMPVGDGAALLSRRPDIRQAERSLAAATARVGVAMADLYPQVAIGLSAGATALEIADLDESEATRFSLGPLLSWSFPNRAAARARVAAAEADAAAALAAFDGAWLTALRETETALSAYSQELERRDALAEASRHSAEAVRLATARFEAGRSSFLDLLQAQLSLTASQLALAESEAALVDLQITLFLALGGGFTID